MVYLKHKIASGPDLFGVMKFLVIFQPTQPTYSPTPVFRIGYCRSGQINSIHGGFANHFRLLALKCEKLYLQDVLLLYTDVILLEHCSHMSKLCLTELLLVCTDRLLVEQQNCIQNHLKLHSSLTDPFFLHACRY